MPEAISAIREPPSAARRRRERGANAALIRASKAKLSSNLHHAQMPRDKETIVFADAVGERFDQRRLAAAEPPTAQRGKGVRIRLARDQRLQYPAAALSQNVGDGDHSLAADNQRASFILNYLVLRTDWLQLLLTTAHLGAAASLWLVGEH